MEGNGFTPTHKRMLAVLADGLPHRREELHACLSDELGPINNIHVHISNMRKKLRARGQDIVCEVVNRRFLYRHVRLLASAEDGYV